MSSSYLSKWLVGANLVTDSGHVLLTGTEVLISESGRQSQIYTTKGEKLGYINGYPFDFLDKKAFIRVPG